MPLTGELAGRGPVAPARMDCRNDPPANRADVQRVVRVGILHANAGAIVVRQRLVRTEPSGRSRDIGPAGGANGNMIARITAE